MKQIYLLIVFCFAVTLANSQNLSISWPLERSNFQQSSAGQSDLWIAGQYRPLSGSTVLSINDQNINIEARAHTLDNNGNPTGTIGSWVIIHSKPTRGVYRGKLTLTKGWYKLEVRVVKISTNTVIETAYINKVGIGDVFVIAGQSNASGFSYQDAPLPAREYFSWSNPVDVLNVINREEFDASEILFPEFKKLEKWDKIAPKGQASWYWAQTGYLLAVGTKNTWEVATNQPVTLFNAARAGTTIDNWYKSSLGQQTYSLYGSNELTDIYTQLRKSLNFYGHMFGVRALLWHQGESDNEGAPQNYYTTQADYQTKLKEVIKKTRANTGKTIPWAIARVSYNGKSAQSGKRNLNVIAAQNALINADSDADLQQVVAGMNSDVVDVPRGGDVNSYLTAAGYQPEVTHFTGSGLETAGWTWAEALRANNTTNNGANTNFAGVYTTSVTPVLASALPIVAVSVSGSSVTLTPETGYVEWRWVSSASNFSYGSSVYTSTSSTTRAFTTTSSGTFRCYFKDANGNLKISQAITLPLPTINSSLRTSTEAEVFSLSENMEQSKDSELVSVYPNPSSEVLNLDLQKLGETVNSVQLIDANGKVIREVSMPKEVLKFEKLPVGIFTFVIKTDNKTFSKKVVIIK